MSKQLPTAVKLSSRTERALARRAADGDRSAYLDLFMHYLPSLSRFVRHQVRYGEETGQVEQGLIDPRGIVDQVYIAGLRTLDSKPRRLTFRNWLRYLALRILRQQIRVEHQEEPIGLALERLVQLDDNVDTELWEFYQPDDICAVEDILEDGNGSPESEIERQETAAEIERQIDLLPEPQRELLRLRLMEGLHADEIAALKNLSSTAVQQSLREACQVIRQNLSAQ